MSTTEFVSGNMGCTADQLPDPSLRENGAAGVSSQGGKGDPSAVVLAVHADRKTVKKAAFQSGLWTITGYASMQVLRLAFNLILTRLLVPEIFGLMALVTVFLQGLAMFSDIGLGPSIVQSKSGDDPQFLNTAWTLQIVRGFALWLCSCLIAWPVAVFYEEPILMWLLPAVGFTAAIHGLTSTAIHTLNRHLRRGRLVALQLGCYVVSMTGTVAYVLWVERTVWALVIGNVVSNVLGVIFSHLLVPGYRNRLLWNRAIALEVLTFGKWIFLNTVCTFLADQADRLIVGKATSMATLGIYQIAVQLALMPVFLLYALVNQLVFPLYSRLYQSSQDLRGSFPGVHPLAAGFAAFLATGLIASGPTAVKCLYGPHYVDAAWMVQLLGIGAWLKMLESMGSSVLWAMGKPRATAINNAVKLVALMILVPAGYWLGGLEGMILGFVGADFIRYFLTMLAVRSQGMTVLRYDIPLSLIVVAVSGTARYVGLSWGEASRWLELGVEITVVTLLWTGVLLLARSWGVFRKPAGVPA
jgi:O-antigen/teichoic acid export membrane protein